MAEAPKEGAPAGDGAPKGEGGEDVEKEAKKARKK